MNGQLTRNIQYAVRRIFGGLLDVLALFILPVLRLILSMGLGILVFVLEFIFIFAVFT